jgi:hypothetical protein
MVLAASLPAPRKMDRRSECDELRMELRAAGSDMQTIADRIYAALIDGDLRRIEHHAGRLASMGDALLTGDYR